MNGSTSRPASGDYRPAGLRLVGADPASPSPGGFRATSPAPAPWVPREVPTPRSRPTTPARAGIGQRLLWAFFLIVAVVGALWEFANLPDASARLDAIPESGFGFAGRELPLNETEKAIFGNARVLKRLYQVGRQRFVLQVVDASRDRHAIHDPLFCFRGAGWTIDNDESVPIPGGAARLLKMHRPDKTAEAILWFTDTQSRHASAARQWLQTILRRVSFGASGPEPILVILQPVSGEGVQWDEVFDQFPALFEI